MTDIEIINTSPNTLSCCTPGGSSECAKCKKLVIFGNVGRCGFSPGRCATHQVIKSAYDPNRPYRRCIVCKHYNKRLTSERCCDCLACSALPNFEAMKDVAEANWYKAIENISAIEVWNRRVDNDA